MLIKLLKDLLHEHGISKTGTVVDTDDLDIDTKELAVLREHKVFVELTEEEAAFHAFKVRGGDAEADVKDDGLDTGENTGGEGEIKPDAPDTIEKAAAEGKGKKAAADQDSGADK